MAKPFVKWAGGKQSLASRLIVHFPDDIARYFEPFLGGGSVFFTLQPQRAFLSDSNAWLIDTYRAIRDDWQRVAALLDSMENSREAYLVYRAMPISSMDLWERAAHLIYLNKTCFRGLFRVNKKGQFNVPYGDYNRRYYDPANLQAASDALRAVELRDCDYEEVLQDVRPGDFIYLDPPYHKLGGYSDFNRYTPEKFKEPDHERLRQMCDRLSAQGARWAQSNSNTPFIRELYGEYRQVTIASRREINLDSASRDSNELLIVNYELPELQPQEETTQLQLPIDG